MRVSQLPLSAGASFKPEHFAAISAAPQPLGFFEVHAENYMGGGGAPPCAVGISAGTLRACPCMASASTSVQRSRSIARILPG